MTYEQIIEHLAEEAKIRMKRGLSQNYRHAILKACDGNLAMMKEVGRLLGQRSLAKHRAAKNKIKPGQQLLFQL